MFWRVVLICLIGPSALGLACYEGSAAVWITFCCCQMAMLFLMAPRPRVYAYTFFSGLLFLGFWPKALVYRVFGNEFLEPVGNFGGSAIEWDAALILASCATSGVVAARLIHLYLARKYQRHMTDRHFTIADPPRWFPRWRMILWLLTMTTIVVLNVVNYVYAFYQVGVRPVVILPLHLNVILAWLINIGFALWIAMLVWWDFSRSRGSSVGALLAPVLEAFLSSISTFSRSFFILHAGPYILTLHQHRDVFKAQWGRRVVARFGFTFGICFLLSISAVFTLRAIYFHSADYQTFVSAYFPRETASPGPLQASLPAYVLRVIEHQGLSLLWGRWIGLEAVLAASSIPDRGADLFLALLTDKAARGPESLFQRHAKSRYVSPNPTKYTFLSNAGVVAILGFSGSYLMVMTGMLLITGILIATEWLAEIAVANPFLTSVTGLALSNVVSQMTFPYLSLVFLLQLWVAIALLSLLARAGQRDSPRSSGS